MLIRSTVTMLLFIITELLASVTGDLRLIVKTFNTGSSTILLTELVGSGILRAGQSKIKKECAVLRACTTEPVALKIKYGNNESQCYYDESENTSCSYRFRLSGSTDDLTTFNINRSFDSELIYILLTCNNQHNISFWNPQENPSLMTFNEPVRIIWSIEQDGCTYFRVEKSPEGAVLYTKTAFISPWTYQIFCNSLPSSSLLPTTMTPTDKCKTATTPISPTMVPTPTVPTPTVPTPTVPTPTGPTQKGLTTRSSYISNTHSSTTTFTTSPIKGDMTNKNNILDGTTQGQGKKETPLTIYIIPSCAAGLILLIIAILTVVCVRRRARMKNSGSALTQAAPHPIETEATQYSDEEYDHYNHLGDRVRRRHDPYEDHDTPTYSNNNRDQYQDSTHSTQTAHNSVTMELHAQFDKPRAKLSSSNLEHDTPNGKGRTTSNSGDMYAEEIEGKRRLREKNEVQQRKKAVSGDLYTQVSKPRSGYVDNGIEMVENDIYLRD